MDRDFEQMILVIARAVGASGVVRVAGGPHTVVAVFVPESRVDAAKMIGRAGCLKKAISALVEIVGQANGKTFKFKVEDVKDGS
ncbi:MAG: hypothetical protein GYA36_19085 [Veillonellaceae bacterium]|nr:hypothetical protein [Veillonellaceae bacterium]